MYERNHELLDIKIRQYLLPAIMMKLALQLGNVVDTMLVGNILGKEAMSAVGITIPVLSMIQIPALFLGNGGATYAGILLGRRQKQEANEVFTISFIFTTLCTLLFSVSAVFITTPMAHLLSGGSSLEADVASCVFIDLTFAPIMCIGIFFARFLSADSHPQLTSAYYIVSNILNLILDFIFLKFTKLGVKGSSLSTALGFSFGLVVMFFYAKSPKRMLSFTRLKPSAEILKNIFSTGAPHLSYICSTMLTGFLLNRIILSLLQENGIVIYTICNNMNFILKMLIGGIIESIPYIISILYGEGDYFGIHAVVKKTIGYAIPVTALLITFILLFPNAITLMFGIHEPDIQNIVMMVLRIYALAIPFKLWNYFGMQYYGAVEKSPLATLTSTLGNGIVLIPVMFFSIMIDKVNRGNGYIGLAVAFVVSEIITVLSFLIYKKTKYPGEPLLLIPDKNEEICLDFTIHSRVMDAVGVAEEIQHFCEEHGVSAGSANMVAIAAEEMAVNIAKYGGTISEWIDVCLLIKHASKEPDSTQRSSMILRLRDNGVAFDPTTYEYDTTGIDYEIHGIKMVQSVASEITYVRAMDLNNTTVTIDI